jgi:hypothetical protein
MEILDLYTLVLRTASMEVEDSGCVNATLGGKSTPKLIDGKRLVLPTKNQLANPNWDDRIAFHPLSENILRGESPIIETLRKDLNVRLNLSVSALAYELMTIAASTAKHASLSPDQKEFLARVPEASEKDLDFLKKLLKEMPFDQSAKSVISLYLKRGGTVSGKRYARVGVINFPLMNELRNGEPKVFGVKPSSAKVRENMVRLLDYIIPKQDEPEAYYRGSDSRTAPYFEALMQGFLAVASPINDVIDLFDNVLEDAEGLRLESEWVEAFQDLDQFAHKIPSLKGNQGNAVAEGQVEAPAPAETTTKLHNQNSISGQHVPPAAAPALGSWLPAVAQAPAPSVNTDGGISFADLTRGNPAIHQQPMFAQQPMPYGQPPQQGFFPQNNGFVPNNMYQNAPAGVMPGSGTVMGGTTFNGSFNSMFNNQQQMPGFRV